MKKIVTIIIVMSFCIISTAMADNRSYMISRMWERQEAGIDGVLQCFKNDCPPSEYKDHLLTIVSAETNLTSYGVSPRNKRLVSHLASDMRSMADFPAFAYKIFKKRMHEMTGFMPEPGGSFKGHSFRFTPKKGGNARPITLTFE